MVLPAMAISSPRLLPQAKLLLSKLNIFLKIINNIFYVRYIYVILLRLDIGLVHEAIERTSVLKNWSASLIAQLSIILSRVSV